MEAARLLLIRRKRGVSWPDIGALCGARNESKNMCLSPCRRGGVRGAGEGATANGVRTMGANAPPGQRSGRQLLRRETKEFLRRGLERRRVSVACGIGAGRCSVDARKSGVGGGSAKPGGAVRRWKQARTRQRQDGTVL